MLILGVAGLQALSEQLGDPSAGILDAAAKKKGLKVTRADVNASVGLKGAQQLYKPLPPSKGK